MNKDRIPNEFKVGDYVWLKEEASKEGRSLKLAKQHYKGLFRVVRIVDDSSVLIQALDSRKRRHVTVDRLKKDLVPRDNVGEPVGSQRNNNKLEVNEKESQDEEEIEYEVEEILSKKTIGKDIQYKVKWKGYQHPTWEPMENLMNSQDLIDEYENSPERKCSLCGYTAKSRKDMKDHLKNHVTSEQVEPKKKKQKMK